MASFRRSMSLMQRDATSQIGEPSPDTSPSSKLSRSWTYLVLRGFVNPLGLLIVFDRMRAIISGISSQRSSRPMEKSRRLWYRHCSWGFFHLFIFFMLGVFIGFTPYLSVDMPRNFVSKHQAFSFKEDLVAGNISHNVVQDDVSSYATRSARKQNDSPVELAALESRGEQVEPLLMPLNTQDLDLAYQKLLIIVTPTYARKFQAYYLNRLAHTLKNVSPPLLWIVVERSLQSTETAEILRGSGIMNRHLVCEQNVTSTKAAYIHQRNVALSHIEKHRLDGILYFAEDDKVYSTYLFDQMRQIRRFGTWPVAMLAENKSRPILEGPVCNGSQVIGWHTSHRNKVPKRFHVDISGFAFNSTILWDSKIWQRPTLDAIRLDDTVKDGLQETAFIEQLVEDESQMEGLPDNCSKIMVWKLHLEAPELFYPPGWLMLKNLDVVSPLT